MSSKLVRSLTFRLALQHAGLFAVLSLATFALVYLTLSSNLARRIDKELDEDVREMAGKLHGLSAAKKAQVFEDDIDAADASQEFRVLELASGKRVVSDLEAWRGVDVRAPQGLAPGAERWRPIDAPEARARVLARRTAEGDLVEFGASLADNEELLGLLRRIFLVGWLLTIVPGALLGFFVARRAMAGVDRVTETALHIGTSDLGQRVPVGREGEEIETLARAFNGMLDRIQ